MDLWKKDSSFSLSFSLSLFQSDFDREIHRETIWIQSSLLWSAKQWFYSGCFSSSRVSLCLPDAACLDNRHRARGTRSGTILAFHTEKTPDARSTYPVLCVKRTGKQNLRLFRGNKNGRARETREPSFASGPRNFANNDRRTRTTIYIVAKITFVFTCRKKQSWLRRRIFYLITFLTLIYLSTSENWHKFTFK